MKCEEARKYLYPLLDNEIDTEKNLEVLSHLDMCEACQKKFEAEEQFMNKLSGSLSDQEAPDSLRNSIREEIQRKKQSRNVVSRAVTFIQGHKPLATAALLLFAVGLVGILQMFMNTPQSASEVLTALPEAHDKLVEQILNTDPDINQIRTGKPHRIQEQFSKEFPELRKEIRIPDLKKLSCKLVDEELHAQGTRNIHSPHFKTTYCLTQNGKHKFATLIVMRRANLFNKIQNSSAKILRKEGEFTLLSQPDQQTRMLLWSHKNLVCAFVSRDLSGDKLFELGRETRKQAKAFRTSSK